MGFRFYCIKKRELFIRSTWLTDVLEIVDLDCQGEPIGCVEQLLSHDITVDVVHEWKEQLVSCGQNERNKSIEVVLQFCNQCIELDSGFVMY